MSAGKGETKLRKNKTEQRRSLELRIFRKKSLSFRSEARNLLFACSITAVGEQQIPHGFAVAE